MGQLIDSSVLIELERRGASVASLGAWLDNQPIALATVSAAELLVGTHRANSDERRRRHESFFVEILEGLEVESFDLPAAHVHARLWAELAATGQMIGAHDLIIAATALSRGYSVLTMNAREFRQVPGLQV